MVILTTHIYTGGRSAVTAFKGEELLSLSLPPGFDIILTTLSILKHFSLTRLNHIKLYIKCKIAERHIFHNYGDLDLRDRKTVKMWQIHIQQRLYYNL